ncbi:butyrophilin subfamily 1 member A1 isoform X2 [Anguilla anguilla]|uniref:butyrophilin subfamily 1 member A1 isoform X2 n=1 Tax=Anguilla anguilla TaxID=7936 RepID=UPI0015A76631|nr:butyrophilin subfamily 1 member A1 isoform X2 [Anguilla anguilla]
MKAKYKEVDKKEEMLLFVFLAALAPLACDAESFSVQVPPDPISARAGSTVTLPCWLARAISAEPMEVRWHRSPSFKTTALHYMGGRLQDSSQDPRFRGRASFGSRGPEAGGLKGGDVSLRLENVTLEDEGEFQCYVSTDQHYEAVRVILNVTVTGTPPVLSVRQANDSLVNVSCASSGWHPRPNLTWSDSQGRSGLSPGAMLYGPAEQGVVSVFSWILTPASDAAWLSCSVFLPGEEEREGRVALLTSRAGDQSGQWKAAFIALLILGLLAMAIAAFLFVRKRRTDSKESVEIPESVPLLQTDSGLFSFIKNKSLPNVIDLDEAANEKVDITLDEDTAHENLMLHKDCKRVRDKDESQGRDPSKNRFTHHLFVLGKEGFTSGRAYWQVGLWNKAVGLKMFWSVGVVSESAKRDCEDLTPSEGYLVFSSDKDNGLSVNTVPVTRLSEKLRPQTLGVFLDYDNNMISFYNVEEKRHILTFCVAFQEKVYPLFGPGKGDLTPLVIQPISDVKQESNVNTAENSNGKSQSVTLPTVPSQSSNTDKASGCSPEPPISVQESNVNTAENSIDKIQSLPLPPDPSQSSSSDNSGLETTAQNEQFTTQ